MANITETILNPRSGQIHVERDDGTHDKFNLGNVVYSTQDSDGNLVRPDMRTTGNRVVIFGSSSTERNNSSSSTSRHTLATGYFVWANAFLGNRLKMLNNAGISGNRIAQMAARVDADVLAYRPDWVIYQLSPNDLLGDGMSATDCVAANIALIEKIRTSGPRVLLLLPYVWKSTFATMAEARRVQFAIFRQMMLDAAYRMPGIVVVDSLPDIVNPSSATADPIATLISDDQHTSSAGAAKIGWSIAQALSKYIAAVPWECNSVNEVWAATDADTQLRRYINQNPLLLGTSGTNGSNSSGDVADGSTVLREAGTGSVECSKIASPRGVGAAQRMVMTSSAANTRFTLQQTISNASSRPIDGLYRALANIRITSQTNLRSVYVSMSFNANASIAGALWRFSSTAQNASDQVLPWSDLPGVITPSTVDFRPSEIISSYTATPILNVACIFDGAGGATVDVFDPSLIRLG